MIRSIAFFIAATVPAAALAQSPLDDLAKSAGQTIKNEGVSAVKGEVNRAVVDKVNAKLLAEGRKNQCSFKSDTDELAPGCDAKAKRLANLLIDAKRTLAAGNLSGYKFVVSGHTDSSGKAEHNLELSRKRAAVMVRELISKGVPAGEIEAVGMGSEKPIIKLDNTDAKRAKNRRYEVQVKI